MITINWQFLALIAAVQNELALQNAVDYKRIQIKEDRPYWTLPVEKEPPFLAFDGECLPIQPSFEVDHVKLDGKGWFCRKQVSSTNDGIYAYWIRFGVSHKCKTVIYYLFSPELWELVGRGK